MSIEKKCECAGWKAGGSQDWPPHIAYYGVLRYSCRRLKEEAVQCAL